MSLLIFFQESKIQRKGEDWNISAINLHGGKKGYPGHIKSTETSVLKIENKYTTAKGWAWQISMWYLSDYEN